MKSIRTRYIGATNFKGAKIKATDGVGNTRTISYPYDLPQRLSHELAAYLLMKKMNWTNTLVGGDFQNDMYWTMREDTGFNETGYGTFLARPEIVDALKHI